MAQDLTVAIIGGGIGRYGIAPALLLHPKVKITAICTSHQETADAFAKQHKIPKAYSSWQELITQDFDALVIATPPFVQAEITAAFLLKKKTCFS